MSSNTPKVSAVVFYKETNGIGKKVPDFTTTTDVIVIFPTKRKSIQSKLEVYEKWPSKKGAAALVQVGNFTTRIIRDQTTICYGGLNYFYLSTRNYGNIKIDCSRLPFFEKSRLKQLLGTYVDTVGQWVGWDWESVNTNNHVGPLVKFVDKSTTQPTNDELQGRTSAVVADGICRGAAGISSLLVAAAANRATALDGKTEELKESFQGYIEPQNLVQIDPGTKDFVQGAKIVTGALATTIGTGGGIIFGEYVWSIIKSGAARFLTAANFEDNIYDARTTVEDFCNVAGGVLSGAGTLLKGVEESAKILAPSVTTYVGEAVGQRYGREVGELTEDSLQTAGNVASIGYNATCFKKQLLVKGVPDARLGERESVHTQMERNIWWKEMSDRGNRYLQN